MERSRQTQVDHAVQAWLRWVPRWTPPTHRARHSVCRQCWGSPVLAAAGIGEAVPHGVKHGFSMRMKTVIDHAVSDYTERNLPLLQRELDEQAARHRAQSYRPGDGLDPDFDGMALDPEPQPGAPFLFTLADMAEQAQRTAPPPPPLTDEEKAALRHELSLADDYANMVGREVCGFVVPHRAEIAAAVQRYVEPQVEALLAELSRSLDEPFDPRA